jgi:SP family sugar:H+ symporter-like MFS transporter
MTTALNWLAHWAIAYATPYMVNEDYANLQSRVFVVRPSVRFAEPVRDGF